MNVKTGSHSLREFGETLALLARGDTHFIRSVRHSLRSFEESFTSFTRLYDTVFTFSRLPEYTQCTSSRINAIMFKKFTIRYFISKNFVYLQPQKSQHEDEGKKRRIQD